MNRGRAFVAFVHDFVIGDDPLIAIVVVLALGATAVIAGAGVAAWWLLPCAVIGTLAVSIGRASRD